MSGGAGKLPTTETGAIKRAKMDIQKLLLNKDESKTAKLKNNAEVSIAHADTLAKSRKDWRHEVLMVSNRTFVKIVNEDDRLFFNWYLNEKKVQWGIDKMPSWAESGKPEPTVGSKFAGKYKYVKEKGGGN
jgi:hypothetical protein